MRKIVIVMTYFERPEQLKNTLKSIAKTKHDNFEVVIVDDGSIDSPVNKHLSSLPLTILRITNKRWTNPEPAYNTGIYYAMLRKPEIVILQNAECYHVGDILSYADKVTNESYISFGCFSLSKQSTFGRHDINELIKNKGGANADGQDAWYNHPLFRPVGYDFCSAITADNLRKLNGYDERFSQGCGFGDDYLFARIKMMGLNVEITETPFVAHQWHYNTPVPPYKHGLVIKNQELFLSLVQENNIRAKRIFTYDL
jgi:glycosyltransferase involved in cell wall biosynthesis